MNRLSDNSHFELFESYLLSDEDYSVRMEAAKVLLFNYNTKRAISPLLWIYEHEKHSKIKAEILKFFIVIAKKDPRYLGKVKEMIKKGLKSRSVQLKLEAIEGCGVLNLESFTPHLITSLETSKTAIQMRAMEALKKLKSKDAVPHLIKKLDGTRLDIWQLALNSLKKIEDGNLENILIDTLENIKQSEKLRNLKKGLIKALGNLGNTDSLKLLIKFLDIDDFELRKTAESALEQIHPKWKTKVNEDLSNRSF